MDLRSVLNAIADIQRGVIIEEPRYMAVKAVHMGALPNGAIDPPCFLNRWAFMGENRRPNAFRERIWEVRMQFFLAPIEVDKAAYSQIAAAFEDAMIDAFDRNILLEGAGLQDFRPEEGIFHPVQLDHIKSYLGLQYLLGVRTYDVTVTGP